MQLVDDGLVPGPAVPRVVGPLEGARIDDGAGAGDIPGIASRRGIGNAGAVGEPERVRGTGTHAFHARGMPATVFALHLNGARRFLPDLEYDMLNGRCPQTEAGSPAGDFRAE